MRVTVTIQHLRALGYCNRGLRKWFAERGIGWPEFLEEGVDAGYLRATGDAMAIAAADLAEAEALLAARAGAVKRGGCV